MKNGMSVESAITILNEYFKRNENLLNDDVKDAFEKLKNVARQKDSLKAKKTDSSWDNIKEDPFVGCGW